MILYPVVTVAALVCFCDSVQAQDHQNVWSSGPRVTLQPGESLRIHFVREVGSETYLVRLARVKGRRTHLIRQQTVSINVPYLFESVPRYGRNLDCRPHDHVTHICCGGEISPRVPNADCCRHAVYNNHTQICCDGTVHHRLDNAECCGDKVYNSKVRICCEGEVHRRYHDSKCCGNKAYRGEKQICCNGKIKKRFPGAECCGSRAYNPLTHICCSGGRLIRRKPNASC
ncbi:hypothetical protein BaRGS_00021321 [Batillaria attramentaria]|uniref:Galaxin-like repeats domain-containing protein n=1 Tax=Batillaria attramentaria TaxID=370345 RepID=A0ABD0KKZ2_9CAEN